MVNFVELINAWYSGAIWIERLFLEYFKLDKTTNKHLPQKRDNTNLYWIPFGYSNGPNNYGALNL